MKKRILALLLSGMMAVCLAACGGGNAEISPSAEPSASPAAVETGGQLEPAGTGLLEHQ